MNDKADRMKIDYPAIKKMLRQYRIDEVVEHGKEIVPHLIRALRDRSMQVRAGAAEALGEISDPAAIPALIKSLGDVSKSVRDTAKDALICLDRAAVPYLLEALEDSKPKIRKNAAEALINMREPSVVGLINALEDCGKNKKENAAKLLLRMVESRLAMKKKRKHGIAGDGELLEGETVKPPEKRAYENKIKNKKVPKLINIHGNRSGIIRP